MIWTADSIMYKIMVRQWKICSSLLHVLEELRMVCLLPIRIAAEEVIPTKGKKSFEEHAWFNLDVKVARTVDINQ
ncbi:MAG: hypothetical protein HFG56_07455 [Lachnospiraceae bacterium]|nr:hypothetical protein [Lachnospiraceae bacterium]